MLVYIFATLTVCIILIRILFFKNHNPASGFVFKCLASLSFCLTAICAYINSNENKVISALILTSLVIALAGDIILTMPNYSRQEYSNLFQTVGGVAFLLGHLLYIAAFFLNSKFFFYLLPVVFLLPLIYCILIKTKIMSPGKNVAYILAYSLVLGVLLLSVVNNLMMRSNFSYIIFVAALLFILSDTSLFIYVYGKESLGSGFTANYLILLPYYIAQALFALSISFI
ncbi:MAG: lysoplasmalogenase [Christensenellaceae bacterium]|nr:lysoplasmalogenase [Christensenellaceae bacterium]